MTRAFVGAALLALGGLAIVAGSFLPEIEVLARNLLRAGPDLAMPDRSHWVVFQECKDMLCDPDETLPSYYYTYYAIQAGGIGYLAVAGVALAGSAAWVRSRGATAAFAAFHALAFLALAWGSWAVWRSMPASSGSSNSPTLGIVVLLAALGVGQSTLGVQAVRSGRLGRICAVDAANLLPSLFLLFLGAGLWIALRRHPNWPSGGYLVMASGAGIALLGLTLRSVGPTA